MRKQIVSILAVGVIAWLGVWVALAQEQPTSTPAVAVVGSPVGSPIASPIAGLVGDVEAGKAAATICLACHSTDGKTIVGPTWKGLYGAPVELEDGTTVIADDAYLARSIKDPMSQIVKGFPPAMPPYSYLTDQQIADLIAYIKSLK